MVSVLLPTAARPKLLRMALNSIAAQTAVGRIDRVVVSENGSDRASEGVCADFPQLPITYFFRDPALKPLEHGQLLMKECLQGEITCILHDDDWWLPHHVEAALAALQAHPDASCYGAKPLLQEVEGQLVDRECELFAWLGGDYPPPEEIWRLSRSNLLLASLLGLVVHYSSMVVRTEALRQSAYVYGLGNHFDNDRMILYAFSQHGPLVYNSKLSVGVRVHPNRDTMRFEQEERDRRMAETTRWMVQASQKPWPLLARLFAQRLARCPDPEKKVYFIREAALRPWCLPEMARNIDRATEKDFFAMYDQARLRFAEETPQADR